MMFDGTSVALRSLGSPGVNELRWLAPLRPGTTSRSISRFLDARVFAQTRHTTGIRTFKGVVRNAANQVLCEIVLTDIVAARADVQARQAG